MFSDAEAADATATINAEHDSILTDRATVWTATGSATGRYDVQLTTGLACHLLAPNMAQPGSVRREEASQRDFRWDRGYVMPEEDVQLEVAGVRWNPVAGSFRAPVSADGVTVAYRACMVYRVVTT